MNGFSNHAARATMSLSEASRCGLRRSLAITINCLVAVTCSRGSGAETSAGSKTIVIELRADERATDLVPILDRLRSRGRVASSAEIRAQACGRMPLPGVTEPTITAAKIRAKIDEAHLRTTGKNFDLAQAAILFEMALRWAYENPVIVVADVEAPRWLTKAYVWYAFALRRLGRTEDAKEQLREQRRSFPEWPVTADQFGPDAADLYKDVQQETSASPQGTLFVTVNRPDAIVSLNEVGQGRGTSFQANVVKGTYRVLVQVGAVSRRYSIKVDPSVVKHPELRVDWNIDANVHVTKDWFGLAGTPPADARERMAACLGATSVRTLSFVESQGERWAVLDGADRCAVALNNDSKKEADVIESCLAGRRAPGVLVEVPSERRADRSIPSLWPAYLTLGVGTAALGAGVYFSGVHNSCLRVENAQCLERRDTRLYAGITFGVAIGTLVYSTLRYVKHVDASARPHPLGVDVSPDGGAVTYSGTF